jgi:hypothetical protein
VAEVLAQDIGAFAHYRTLKEEVSDLEGRLSDFEGRIIGL